MYVLLTDWHRGIYQGIQSVQFNFYGCMKHLFRRSYIDKGIFDINLHEIIAFISPSFINTLLYDKYYKKYEINLFLCLKIKFFLN